MVDINSQSKETDNLTDLEAFRLTVLEVRVLFTIINQKLKNYFRISVY